jgi:hypothetical protein
VTGVLWEYFVKIDIFLKNFDSLEGQSRSLDSLGAIRRMKDNLRG